MDKEVFKTLIRIATIVIGGSIDFGLLCCACEDSFDEPWEKILLVVNIVAFISIVCWAWS